MDVQLVSRVNIQDHTKCTFNSIISHLRHSFYSMETASLLIQLLHLFSRKNSSIVCHHKAPDKASGQIKGIGTFPMLKEINVNQMILIFAQLKLYE